MEDTKTPTVFISYCWKKIDPTDPESPVDESNLQRVRAFADALQGKGVEVLLDLYHLKPGDDRFLYMERIADKKIDHVLSLCEQEYQQKFDQRAGGVGVEAFIMTPDLYAELGQQQARKKFIPVVWERGPQGQEYLPVAMRGKFYVDMTQDQEKNFVKLLRFLHNEPEFVQPPLGQKPRFD